MSPDQFLLFAETLPEPLFLVTGEGEILEANTAAHRLLGVAVRHLGGIKLHDLVQEGPDKLDQCLRLWARSREMLPTSLRLRSADGSTVKCYCRGGRLQPRSDELSTLIVLRCQQKQVLARGFVTLNEQIERLRTEITEHKRTEEALEKGAAKYRTLFNSANDAIFLMQGQFFIDCNPKALEMFGCKREEIVGNTPAVFSPDRQPDDRLSTEKAMEKINATLDGKPQSFEWVHRRLDGTVFNAEVSLNLIKLAGESFIQAIARDITERKRTEEIVRNIAAGVSAQTGETFFRHLVEHLATIFDTDYAFIGVLDKGDLPRVNTLAVYAHGQIADNIIYSLVGTPCANVIGQSTCAYSSGVQQQFPQDQMLADMGVEGYLGTPLFNSKGAPLGILVVLDSKPLQRIGQRSELLEIFAARAGAELERMQAEEALQEKEARIRGVVESALDAVIVIDENSVIIEWNTQAELIFGWKSSDILGRTLMETIIPPQYHEGHQRGIEKLRATGEGPFLNRRRELTALHREGREFAVELSVSVLRRGETWVFSAFVRDLTERRQAEEVLRRSQKMEAIGQLSGGIAHDFNNQLGIVIGYLDFLKNYAANDDGPRQWVNTATKATLRCMDLTRQLLAFSRRKATTKVIVDLNATLKELETMIARSVTPEVEVEYFLADDLWQTEIDPGEFQDAILNLVINARDAMPEGGKLLIETTNKHIDTNYAALNPRIEAGHYVQLMLSDTGTGMDKDTLEHLFEPFFTTKPEGKGTGLGLAMVYGFVKRYGGYIKVYSEPGTGTTIRLYLPRSTVSESAVISNDTGKAELLAGSESILIVDDESDLLELADLYLSDLGYRTLRAETTTQALAILAGDQEIDLLFSDVVMPAGMNGYELAQQATAQRPNLKVLLTSGFTLKTIARNGLARFAAHLLSKPYRKADLAQRIRIVLDEEAGI